MICLLLCVRCVNNVGQGARKIPRMREQEDPCMNKAICRCHIRCVSNNYFYREGAPALSSFRPVRHQATTAHPIYTIRTWLGSPRRVFVFSFGREFLWPLAKIVEVHWLKSLWSWWRCVKEHMATQGEFTVDGVPSSVLTVSGGLCDSCVIHWPVCQMGFLWVSQSIVPGPDASTSALTKS